MKKLFLIILTALVLTGCASNGTNQPETNNNKSDSNVDAEVIVLITDSIKNGEYETAYKQVGKLNNEEEKKKWSSKFTVIENVLISENATSTVDAIGNPGETSTIYYKYNKNGQIIAAIAEGDVIDTNQRTIMVEHLQLINYLLGYEEYAYNEQGQLVTLTGYKDIQKERKRYVAQITYNELGQKTKVEYTTEDGLKAETSFQYNDEGKLVSVKYNSDSIVASISEREIKYDSSGLKQVDGAQIDYDESGRITQITYDNGTVFIRNYGDFYVYEE